MKQHNLLQRFFGLEKEGMRQALCQGGIDNLQPGQISGWVVAKEVRLHEVRLIMGDILLAKAEINQPRLDVCQTLNCDGQPGFTIELSHELPQVNWQNNPKVIAISLDGAYRTELGLLGNKLNTTRVLKSLLQSELLGMIGHCDGLVQGLIRGWAGWKGQAKPATVWLQTEGEVPMEIICDRYREGMQTEGIHGKCGFEVAPLELPVQWAGKSIWFSFDQEGNYRLPQEESVVVSNGQVITQDVILPNDRTDKNLVFAPKAYQGYSDIDSQELSEHWRRLEEIKQYLDQVENHLSHLARTKDLQGQTKQQSVQTKSWMSRIFSRDT